MAQTARNRILSGSYCSRRCQLCAQLLFVLVRIWSRAALSGRPVAVHQMCDNKWYKSRSRQIRGRASYSEERYLGTKGLSNPYYKVGGCASALASESTEIAVHLKISPPCGLPHHGSGLGCVFNDLPQIKNWVQMWMFEDKLKNKFVFWIYFQNILNFEFSKKKKKLFCTIYLKIEQNRGPKCFNWGCATLT